MVADWHCIVRKLVRVADGRVKPGHDVGPAMTWAGHDVGDESRYFWRLVLVVSAVRSATSPVAFLDLAS